MNLKCTGSLYITEVKMAINKLPEAYHENGSLCPHMIYSHNVLMYDGRMYAPKEERKDSMRDDAPETSAKIQDVLREIAERTRLPGDYVLIARITVDTDGTFYNTYDWFWRAPDPPPPGMFPLSAGGSDASA
jgi:hypothetical protein